MRWGVLALSAMAGGLIGCGSEGEMTLVNTLDTSVGLEVRAPLVDLRGGCNESFATRFCAEEYEIIGVLDFAPAETRPIIISDPVSDDQCTNVLWLRLVWLGAPDEMPLGPAQDPGTLVDLPATIEIEDGHGALHGVAFPGRTVRLDEVGGADLHQARPPQTCAELGRPARS